MNGARLVLGLVAAWWAFAGWPARAFNTVKAAEQHQDTSQQPAHEDATTIPSSTNVIRGRELASVIPTSFFFGGHAGTLHSQDATGLRFADGALVLITKADSAGYASGLRERYQFAILTEVPLAIGGKVLPAGAYGAGFLNGSFLVMNVGAQEILSVPAKQNAASQPSAPLELVPDLVASGYRLVNGRASIALARVNPSSPVTAGSATQVSNPSLQFSDSPDFAVAGIVDYTAVGGHGSDATLRTSEDLARQTFAQRTPSIDPQGPGSTRSEEELRAAVLAAPDSYAAVHALGETCLRAGHYAEAIPLLEHASRMHGGSADDEYALALALDGAGEKRDARQHVMQALAGQQQAKYHSLAAEIDESLGDPVSAVEHDRRATLLDPSEANYDAWGSELLLHRAIWQAAEVFQSGAKLHPASERLRTGWAAALFAEAQYSEAAKRVCEAADLYPASLATYQMMGKVMLSSPELPTCLAEHLARFAVLYPENAEASYYEAMALLRQNEVSNAKAAAGLLERSVTLNPKLAAAYVQLGILEAGENREPEAIADFKRAVAADPQLAEAHYRLGRMYDHAGQAEQGRRELEIHQALIRAQAAAAEQDRRNIKQFVVTPAAK